MEALIATLQLGALRLGPEVINGRAASACPSRCRRQRAARASCISAFLPCLLPLTRRLHPFASAVVGFLGVFLNEIATGRSIWGQFFGAGFFSAVGLMAAVSVASVAPLITGAVPAAKVFPSGASAGRALHARCAWLASHASLASHPCCMLAQRRTRTPTSACQRRGRPPRRCSTAASPVRAPRGVPQLQRMRAPCQLLHACCAFQRVTADLARALFCLRSGRHPAAAARGAHYRPGRVLSAPRLAMLRLRRGVGWLRAAFVSIHSLASRLHPTARVLPLDAAVTPHSARYSKQGLQGGLAV
jgi:hypothetical protein